MPKEKTAKRPKSEPKSVTVTNQPTNKRKIGVVVSDKMDKSVVVAIESARRHPIYHKAVKRTSRIFAHDEEDAWKIGDVVVIEESHPVSRHKSWVVVAGERGESAALPGSSK